LTGSIVAAALFVVGVIFCLRRIQNEEREMLSLFPRHYAAYRARTRQLIPPVW
jgi:protein-S-isoprenylcysteine O-methyltransferase Ste14